MKRRRSPSPLHGSFLPSKTTAPLVLEALKDDVAESGSSPRLRRTDAGPSASLPVPSVIACISGSNQFTTLDDVEAKEDLRAPVASSRSRPTSVPYEYSRDSTEAPLDKEQTGRPTRVQEFAQATLGKGRKGKSLRTQETHLSCSQEALFPGETDGRWAGVSTFETDTERGGQWLTQQQAGEEFCLPIQTLRDAASEGLLKVEKRPNPYGATYAPMRLYQRCELRQLAFQMWGGEAGVEKERERRREQRWQQRQQRMSSVLCESGALQGGSVDGKARPGRSLPDLRTFLRSSSKKKSTGALRNTCGSARCTSAAIPVTREAADTQSFSAHKDSIATSDCKEEANNRRMRARRLHRHENVRKHPHSSCPQDVWEEI